MSYAGWRDATRQRVRGGPSRLSWSLQKKRSEHRPIPDPARAVDLLSSSQGVRTLSPTTRECRNRGKTVIYSTHVMSEVEKLCDTIGIIHDGKLMAEGTLAGLRATHGEQDMEEIFVKIVGAEDAK